MSTGRRRQAQEKKKKALSKVVKEEIEIKDSKVKNKKKDK